MYSCESCGETLRNIEAENRKETISLVCQNGRCKLYAKVQKQFGRVDRFIDLSGFGTFGGRIGYYDLSKV